MARMLELLDVSPGARVLEVGAGTGYNAALLASMGAAVTTVDNQPDVAAAAAEHLEAAGIPLGEGSPEAGSVLVVTADGAAPPGGPYDRIIATAALWALPAALVGALVDGGILVAPLRINGVEAVFALRRDGAVLHASGGLPCGFMPLRGGDEQRPWRWPLGRGGMATADADLGDEGRGNVDRLLATEGRDAGDPLGLEEGEHPHDALLWLALQGDPLLTLVEPPPDGGPPGWQIALDVLPASLLAVRLGGGYARVDAVTLYGGEGALRTCAHGMASWRAAGKPGPERLELAVEPRTGREDWSLPYPRGDGASTLVRGGHRWTLRFAAKSV
jgi:protein-L-isoaspartate(D-aspartate) O-methyltransferase